MSDLPSALGIEAVELVSEGGRSLTVRVTGRWRRRRPEMRGQAMLVVETDTGRQRFPAMPEPPSLIGAAPGTWRMSFTVPADLAPQLPGGTFLQLGAVMVRLPVGEVPLPAEEVAEGPPPELLEARQLRTSELAAESARRRAAEAEATVARLRVRIGEIEDELTGARAESDRLRGVISERERVLRDAQQHVHAERALRAEVEQTLATKTRAAAHDLRVLHEHVADLERDLTRMRRAVDEAEHLVAAAEAARAEAERRLAERPPAVGVVAPEAALPAPGTAEVAPEAALPASGTAEVAPEAALPAPGTAEEAPEATVRAPEAAVVEPERPPPEVDRIRARAIGAEFDRARATPPPATAVAPRRAPARPGDESAIRMEATMAERRSASHAPELADARAKLSDARAELADARAELADARAKLADARAELADARDDLADAHDDLEDAGPELDAVRRELEDQRRRNVRAYEAIEYVRRELEQIRATALIPSAPAPMPASPASPAPTPALTASAAPTPALTAPVAPALPPADAPAPPAADAPAPPPADAQAPPLAEPPPAVPGPVQAEQLSAALARLRQTTPAPEPELDSPDEPAAEPAAEPATPERPATPWLGKAFRALAAHDPSEAGRLLLALLPAQRAADPDPVAYDLIMGDLVCAHVTVDSVAVHVDVDGSARPAFEVDFRIMGHLASIARLLVAGPVRRLLGRLPFSHRLARVEGDRGRLPALEHLIDAPLTVGQLHEAGVRLDPVLGMTLAALMIAPAWTAGERFSIAHQKPGAVAPDSYLQVRDGGSPLASAEAPHGPVASIVVCPADELLPALAGDHVASVAINGDERPIALIRQWLDRAQCG